MAGGKETPRQKMIGMMYLVLTALLALNVSKSILDAFISLEENIQSSAHIEWRRGEEKKQILKEKSMDKSGPDAQKKATKLLRYVQEIDKETEDVIQQIDALKIKILTEAGENIQATNKEEQIIVQDFAKTEPTRPKIMNLSNVQGQDKYDEPMRVMLGEETNIKQPAGDGLLLWSNLKKYRNKLAELLVESSSNNEKKYSFSAPNIQPFNSLESLEKQIDEALKKSQVNRDDQDAVKKIFMSLTKNDFYTVHDEPGVHWLGKTFDHSPLVAGIAALTSLQKEVLTARADAITVLQLRVGGGEYSFNSILPLAYGPTVVNEGEAYEVEVMMAAYDSDRRPVITVDQGGSLSNIKNGKGIVVGKAGLGETTISGTITIVNKAGIPKTERWEKKIIAMKPSGAISIPKLNVLYRGIDNIVAATASGFDKSILTGSNVQIKTVRGNEYNVQPGAGRNATLVLTGVNSLTGKKMILSTINYRVMNIPNPEIFWGATPNGGKAPLGNTKLFARYGDGIPLDASFKILSWECNIPGLQGAPPTGNSDDISKAISVARQARPGTTITFTCQVLDPTNRRRYVTSSFKL